MFEKKSKNTKRGGARPNAGRKKGSPNKKTAALIKAVEDSGITPLDFMLNIMRGECPANADPAAQIAFAGMRFEAAKAAAPYVHPKLANVEHDHSSSDGSVLPMIAVRFVDGKDR